MSSDEETQTPTGAEVEVEDYESDDELSSDTLQFAKIAKVSVLYFFLADVVVIYSIIVDVKIIFIVIWEWEAALIET